MDIEEQSEHLRTELTPVQRTADMRLTIDPGFLHHRKIETLLGDMGMPYVDQAIRDLPDLPEWIRKTRIDHIYMQYLLGFCEHLKIPTLSDTLAAGRGQLFCSTEELGPVVGDIYRDQRVTTPISVFGVESPKIELQYSTQYIFADTTRSQLAEGSNLSVIAELSRLDGERLIFHPLLIGSPWLSSKTEQPPFAGPEWYSWAYFENFIEDIDEFSKVVDVDPEDDISIMRSVSENSFKQCMVEILGDAARKDWGGEMSDHYTAHIHLSGKRTTAAFLLKGPAKFSPMGLNHLGKNNDQIFRLAQEPASLLVVQHSHEILAPVRATLRAFAVRPGAPRRYCLIGGRDSLRLLKAYDKLDRALELSGKV